MPIIVGGAELFTGNNLIAVARDDRRVTTCRLLRDWLLVYLIPGNIADARVT